MKKNNKQFKKSFKITISLIVIILILILSWFLFAKNLYFKYSDFKKLSASVEKCKLNGGDFNVYKVVNNKEIFFSGDRGEFIPCTKDGDNISESCEAIISSLKSCENVFDNISDKKIYNPKMHGAILSNILNAKNQNTNFKIESEKDQNSKYVISKYEAPNISIILKKESDVDAGIYNLVENGKDTNGDWVAADNDKNTINLLNSNTVLKIKGDSAFYEDKELKLVK